MVVLRAKPKMSHSIRFARCTPRSAPAGYHHRKSRRVTAWNILFAFKRDGKMIAPPRVTYSSHDAPAEVRDVYRDAVNAALARCMPLHFSNGMGGAVAGRPIAIRFVDDRTIDNGKSLQ
jgi:hypothetical protein